ncbi:UNVERIFIED_CONTAM: hypothetical protein HHA_247770 [Hammondia hammondi]|eukprot:XP_008883814.1 hypothetical protein HHA_247770 [Hammondia hammondi]
MQPLQAVAASSRLTKIPFFGLSAPRLGGNHIYLGRFHDFNNWEYLPHPKLQKSGAIKPIGSQQFNPAGKVLRGSGLHGPENGEFFRLMLWNRLRQKGMRREVPTIEQMREYNRMDVSLVYFCWGLILFLYPMALYARSYATEHGHFPFAPARTDGSRGHGPLWWFIE